MQKIRKRQINVRHEALENRGVSPHGKAEPTAPGIESWAHGGNDMG